MSYSILELDISADIEERQEILLSTKTLYARYDFAVEDEQLYLNYSFPIIYSVWEGFIQTTFQTYIREINKLALRYEELCDEIIILHIEQTFKQLRQYPSKLTNKIKYVESLRKFFKEESFTIHPIVNTESNVGFNVLNRILNDFNLSSIPEYPRANYNVKDELDKFLLKLRNDIAHGKNAVLIKRVDVERAIDLVEYLMELVLDKVRAGFLAEKRHLRQLL